MLCNLRCLSINSQSLCSQNKLPDGTVISNLKAFQDLVYAEDLDIIAATETWLSNSTFDNKIIPSGYSTIRRDRLVVLLALKNSLTSKRIELGEWSTNLS